MIEESIKDNGNMQDTENDLQKVDYHQNNNLSTTAKSDHGKFSTEGQGISKLSESN